MKVERQENRLYKVITVFPFEHPLSQTVRVIQEADTTNLKKWETPTLSYGGVAGSSIEDARRYAEGILEACRIAEELAAASPAEA
jgi:hypothetical protein